MNLKDFILGMNAGGLLFGGLALFLAYQKSKEFIKTKAQLDFAVRAFQFIQQYGDGNYVMLAEKSLQKIKELGWENVESK